MSLPLHPNPSFNAAELRGLVPDPRSVAANGGRFAMVQTQQLPQQPPFQAAQASPIAQQTLREAVTGPAGSHTTAGEPIGTSVLPSRVQANLNSIEEAGVGPMAPLVEDDNSHQSTNSSTDEQDVSHFTVL